ncbi:hypothetical protein B2J93_2175 [Marssonina coronariae]|uniref:SMODS and SLOG-associating 2TM effector domain-containing protein n=1 Tax=Diplocarpon coronariae TaxID=2795749 RepID=A0A218Z7Z5_9HELO|nr:hypothetical protein B2J93_2175 [Marssonina coronariae]
MFSPAAQQAEPSILQQQPDQVRDFGRLELDPTDNLNLFRHLTGILTHASMAHGDDFFSSSGLRSAPNPGLYARVVHNEQAAKIIVAAALTALGAGGGGRGAVTVFGAINTVFAGILTFLRSSSLPNRMKYYQTEWQRVREFIKPRERNFSRPDRDLDAHAMAAIVEAMYEDVKMDLEASTPDRFAGIRKSAITWRVLPRMQGLNEKGKEFGAGFGSRVKGLASETTHFAHQARDIGKDLQTQKERAAEGVSKEVGEHRDRAERMEHMFGDKVQALATEIGQRVHMAERVVHDAEARERSAMDSVVRYARDHEERLEAAGRNKATGGLTISADLHSVSTSKEHQDAKEKREQ